ncbi:ATP-binding protein [Massilia sp. W12]|uniref:ATP-binding protein n=1 Tax=Massilia sp. W12 TaxID=3126507 RepID=UPI0030CE917A
MIAWFASLSQQQALQARLEQAAPDSAAAIALAIELAWYLRQSDPARAHQLSQHSAAAPAALRLRARLIQAEQDWLMLRLEAGWKLAASVLQESAGLAHEATHEIRLLQADAHALLYALSSERGAQQDFMHHAQTAQSLAQQAGDALRSACAQCAILTDQILRGLPQAAAICEDWLQRDWRQQAPALLAVLGNALGLYLHPGAHMERALSCYILAAQASQQSGQMRRAIIAASNVSRVLANLNELDGALEWTERSLQLVRPYAWPGLHASCLVQYSECLMLLGRSDEAQQIGLQALQMQQPQANSRNYCHTLMQMGHVELRRKDFQAAYDWHQQLAELAQKLQHPDFLASARIGLLRALCGMGQAENALQQGLDWLPGMDPVELGMARLDILQALAAACATLGQHAARLHWLQQALALAHTIPGMQISAALLDELAQASKALGLPGQALEFARQANRQRSHSHNQSASQRAQAMQIRHQSERVQQEAEHLQALAAAEARRVAALEDMRNSLTLLGEIGCEMHSRRKLDDLFLDLQQQLHNLLDAKYCTLLLPSAEGDALETVFRLQDGAALPPYRVALDAHDSHAVISWRERRSLLIDAAPGQDNPMQRSDAPICLSALFGPLLLGERVLGVLTIQAPPRHAYGERELLIFNNLCAYGAVALENVQAWQTLEHTWQELVEQDKLAALGRLVSGVAQELSAPLAASLSLATEREQALQHLQASLQSGALNAAGLSAHCQQQQATGQDLLQHLQHAANLISSFKQIAVDRANASARDFDLAITSQEVADTLINQVRQGGHQLTLAIAPGIVMHSYPGPYGQALYALLSNALTHAFKAPGGQITLRAAINNAQQVHISLEDNGCGIAAERLEHIFEAFTRPPTQAQSGNGLGLSICHNIVTQLLGGQIEAHSQAGAGTVFHLYLPLDVA